MDAGELDRQLADRTGSRRAVILGSDAVASIAPCSAAGVARMCTAVGFDVVAGPSCGDELVARALLDDLAERTAPVAIGCCCPRVRERLDNVVPPIGEAQVVRVVPPPVAAARYLRRKHGPALHVTFVGECPGADDGAIDVRLTPRTFVALLANRGVLPVRDETPDTTDAPNAEIEPLARHLSTPGGVPARRYLARSPVDRVLRETDSDQMASVRVPARSRVLLDLSAAAGCTCAVVGATLDDAEPPRSTQPLIVAPPGLNLRQPPAVPSVVSATAVATSVAAPAQPLLPAAEGPEPGARGPAAARAAAPGSVPSTERPAPPETRRQNTVPRSSSFVARPVGAPLQRRLMLASTPVLVLVLSAALGIAAYSGATPGREPARHTPHEAPVMSADTSSGTTDIVSRGSDAPADSTSVSAPPRAAAPLPASGTALDDRAGAKPDTVARTPVPPRPRRRQRVDVVPGWLPQGDPAWNPADTAARPVRDSTVKPRTRPDTVPQP